MNLFFVANAPVVSMALVSDTGSSPSDRITSNPAVKGTGQANTLVTIKDGASTLGTAMADSTGVWSFTPTGLTNGAHTLSATQTDLAGNTGTASLSLTLDKTALTYVTSPVRSAYNGQIIQDLDIYVPSGTALTITYDNVVIRNCRIHHQNGPGIYIDSASNVTIENCEIINSDPPSGINPETSTEIYNIEAYRANSPTIKNVTLRDGSSGIYLLESPNATISHVDGYNFHGPMPRGQFIQFDKSGGGTLTDFYAYNDPKNSYPEDVISVYASPNVTIARGVVDGDNSPSGVGVMFERGSTGGRVSDVDAIHQGNGAFSSYDSNVVFETTRSFDNIKNDQGRGVPLSGALIWNVSATGVSILTSTYTNPAVKNNIVWSRSLAAVADVHEDPGAIPMTHISNHFSWN